MQAQYLCMKSHAYKIAHTHTYLRLCEYIVYTYNAHMATQIICLLPSPMEQENGVLGGKAWSIWRPRMARAQDTQTLNFNVFLSSDMTSAS